MSEQVCQRVINNKNTSQDLGREYIWAGHFNHPNVAAAVGWLGVRRFEELAWVSANDLRKGCLNDDEIAVVRRELVKRGLELAVADVMPSYPDGTTADEFLHQAEVIELLNADDIAA